MEYYSFHPKKNQAFRLYFSLESYQSGDIEAASTFDYVGLSKDGGTFDACTNNPVEVAYDTGDGGGGARSWGRYYIDLTAAEMNADFIIFGWSDNVSTGKRGSIFIKTTTIDEEAIPATVDGGGSGMSLSDTIDINVDAPLDECTVEGLLAILVRRLKRGSQKL